MAERAAVNRLTKVRFLPGARQDASSKSLGLTACIGVGTGFRTYVGSIPTKQMHLERCLQQPLPEVSASKIPKSQFSSVQNGILFMRQ